MTLTEVPDMVGKVIDTLAQHFGATGAYLWSALVKYQFADGVTSLTIGGLCLLVAITFLVVSVKFYKTGRKEQENPHGHASEEGFYVVCVIAAIFAAILLVPVCINVDQGLVKVVAPEGAALNQVLVDIGSK